MTVYRAVCEVEASLTLIENKLQFVRRYKWFSSDLDWIKKRVMDGYFNNSQYRPKYVKLLAIEIDDICIQHIIIGRKEIRIDRRKIPLIKINGIKELK